MPPAVARQVEDGVDEQAPRPGFESIGVAERVELFVGHELHQRRLDRVLEVVLELGIAAPAEGEPVLAEPLQHRSEPRIRRPRMRRAQDAEDGFRGPSQHVNRPMVTLTEPAVPGQGSEQGRVDTAELGGTSPESRPRTCEDWTRGFAALKGAESQKDFLGLAREGSLAPPGRLSTD